MAGLNRRSGAGVALALLAATGIGPSSAPPPLVVQPLPFNHQRHVEEGVGCTDCHSRAAIAAKAGHPLLKACVLCHQEQKGESAAEAKLREFITAKTEVPWVRVNRLVGHVYFSHEAHVTRGQMDCAECHGDMKSKTTPTTASQIDHLDMRACMECHERRGAANDCITCHQ